MDATPLESDLLRHREFLLRLATGLVGGNDAEDLVQDVWVRAVEHPRTPGTGGSGWLARVARNLAVNRFRARARRADRERDAARPEATSAGVGEVEERFELGQRLAAAVGALEEPYRAVILLRFFEGLSHAEIARRLELPLATVRTRQQRALARLRERLDRESGGREAWSAALGSWVARQGLAPVGFGATGAMVAVGATAAVLALVAGAWWARGRDVQGVGSVRPSLDQSGPATSRVPPAVSSVSSGVREAVAPAEEQGTGAAALARQVRRLAGRVVGLSAEEHGDARVTVTGMLRQYVWPREVCVEGPVSGDGSFEVDVTHLFEYQEERNDVPPVELVVWVDHPSRVRGVGRVLCERGVQDERGDVRYAADEIALLPAAVIRGQVLDDAGAPAGKAQVEAFLLRAGPEEQDCDLTECAADGRFRLRVPRGGELAVVALKPGWRPSTVFTSAEIGVTRELTPLRLERGLTIAGRTSRIGQPLPGASVYLSPTSWTPGVRSTSSSGISLRWIDGRFELGWLTDCRADDRGLFRVDGLAPVEYQLYISDLPGTRGGLSRRPDHLTVTAPADGIVLELDAALVTLDVQAAADANEVGRILVRQPGEAERTFPFLLTKGPATFTAPPHQPLSLQVEMEGMGSVSFDLVTPGPGEELSRTVALTPAEPAHLELEPTGREGFDIEEIRLSFYAFEDREKPRYYRSPRFERLFDASTAFALDVPPGHYWVTAWVGAQAGDRSYYSPLEFELDVPAGGSRAQPLDFVLGGFVRVDARTPHAKNQRVQFRLLDSQGEQVPIQFDFKMEGQGRGSFSYWYLVPGAPSETETSLPPGDYTLVLWDDDLAERRVPVRVVAGETTDVTVTMQPK